MVLVELGCGETRGLGYTYADKATASEAQARLKEIVHGGDALRHAKTWQKMLRHIRNVGETGIVRMAIPVYGSGGSISDNDKQWNACSLTAFVSRKPLA